MKATEANLLGFIRKSPRFVIPIYQRTYSWTERECRQLWDDILRAGTSEAVRAHFVGSVVYIQDGLYSVTSNAPLLVIDGQQRLTTVMLLLAALAKELEARPEGQREPLEDFTPEKLRQYYLINPLERGERYYKLLLSQTDRATLTAIVDGGPAPPDASVRVTANYALFSSWLTELKDLQPLCAGLAKLLVIDTSLTRGEDNPQLIFESMNSTGKELSQADLIRNFVLMGLEPTLQSKLYKDFWHPMELDFGQDTDAVHFDPFMRHYLTYRTGDIPRQDGIYTAFKAFCAEQSEDGRTTQDILSEVRRFAGHYCAIALPGKETDSDLARAFADLRDLKVDVAYPLLLELYADYSSGVLTKADFLKAIRWVESYVFRRSICGLPANGLNRIFAQFGRSLKKDRYLESIEATFMLLQSYRRFPSDREFERDIKTRDLYNFPRKTYWLRRMENHGRKERVPVSAFTIEHIMPQNKAVPDAWRQELGPDWEAVHQTWLHTLGNLTLTAYNPEYSDLPFAHKRDRENGLGNSPLNLNLGLGQVKTWNLDAIQARAGKLAERALEVWPSPRLTPETLLPYRKTQTQKSAYSIDDHVFLQAGHPRELFDAIYHELMALDLSVRCEFWKLYVAFKAETNFVDIIAQAKGLILSFNVPFAEIDDPRGLCVDVTAKGRWGNGPVEARFSELKDMPYLMRFARQALDRQLGGGDGP